MPRQSKRKKPAASASKRGPGQPEKEIDLKQLETLCQMQATTAEIAAWFGCSPKTIERHREKPEFKAAMEHGRLKGLVSLRRAMFQNALSGNVASQIFLAKNLLGMRDRPKDDDVEEVKPTAIEYRWVATETAPKDEPDPNIASDMNDKPEATVQ